jgi:hypothetical protein
MKRALVKDDETPSKYVVGPGVQTQVYPSGGSVSSEFNYAPFAYREDGPRANDGDTVDAAPIGSTVFVDNKANAIINMTGIEKTAGTVVMTMAEKQVHFAGVVMEATPVVPVQNISVAIKGPVSIFAVGDDGNHQLAPLMPVMFKPYLDYKTDKGFIETASQDRRARKVGQLVPAFLPAKNAEKKLRPSAPLDNMYKIRATGLSPATLNGRHAIVHLLGI